MADRRTTKARLVAIQREQSSAPAGVITEHGQSVSWDVAAEQVRQWRVSCDRLEPEVVVAAREMGVPWSQIAVLIGTTQAVLRHRYRGVVQ